MITFRRDTHLGDKFTPEFATDVVDDVSVEVPAGVNVSDQDRVGLGKRGNNRISLMDGVMKKVHVITYLFKLCSQ